MDWVAAVVRRWHRYDGVVVRRCDATCPGHRQRSLCKGDGSGHGDYGAFWKDAGASVVHHLAEYKDIPEYHTTGWYDSWGTQVANLNYVELRRPRKASSG